MAKLYFNYGAMGCGKTRDIMKTFYNYKERGKDAIIIKPILDRGANIALRAPTTILHSPEAILRYSSYFSAGVNSLCKIATFSLNLEI